MQHVTGAQARDRMATKLAEVKVLLLPR